MRQPEIALDVELTAEICFNVDLTAETELIAEFGAYAPPPSPVPPYTGSYTVIPTFSEQILETKNKRMTDDVSVHAIEVQRAGNPQGGLTVYIGGILNG